MDELKKLDVDAVKVKAKAYDDRMDEQLASDKMARMKEERGVVPPAPAGVPGPGSSMAPGPPAPQGFNPAKPAPTQSVGGGIKAPGAGGITDLSAKKPITSPMFGKSEDYDKISPLYAELFKAEMELEEMEKGSGKYPGHSRDKIATDTRDARLEYKISNEKSKDAESLASEKRYNEAAHAADDADVRRERGDSAKKEHVGRIKPNITDPDFDGDWHDSAHKIPNKVLKSEIEEIDTLLNELEKARVPSIHPKDKLRFEGDPKHTPGLEKDEPEK